jgi:hypothetical protein
MFDGAAASFPFWGSLFGSQAISFVETHLKQVSISFSSNGAAKIFPSSYLSKAFFNFKDFGGRDNSTFL